MDVGAGCEGLGGLENNFQVLHFNIWSLVIVFEVGKMEGREWVSEGQSRVWFYIC